MTEREMTAYKGAQVRVTFEGILRDNLPVGWDNLWVDTKHSSVYVEFSVAADVQIEILAESPVVPRRMYRDQQGKEGFTMLDAEEDLFIHWVTGGSEEVSEMADSRLPLVQVYPPLT